MRLAITLAALGLGGCGPLATTYEVDITPVSRCTIRGGEESCETPTGERVTRTLVIEPRGDQVYLLLGEFLFVAPAPTAPLAPSSLTANRVLEQTNLETGCVRHETQTLQVTPTGGMVEGTLEEEEQTTGPEAQCGLTPFGSHRRHSLQGTEIEGP